MPFLSQLPRVGELRVPGLSIALPVLLIALDNSQQSNYVVVYNDSPKLLQGGVPPMILQLNQSNGGTTQRSGDIFMCVMKNRIERCWVYSASSWLLWSLDSLTLTGYGLLHPNTIHGLVMRNGPYIAWEQVPRSESPHTPHAQGSKQNFTGTGVNTGHAAPIPPQVSMPQLRRIAPKPATNSGPFVGSSSHQATATRVIQQRSSKQNYAQGIMMPQTTGSAFSAAPPSDMHRSSAVAGAGRYSGFTPHTKTGSQAKVIQNASQSQSESVYSPSGSATYSNNHPETFGFEGSSQDYSLGEQNAPYGERRRTQAHTNSFATPVFENPPNYQSRGYPSQSEELSELGTNFATTWSQSEYGPIRDYVPVDAAQTSFDQQRVSEFQDELDDER